MANTGVFVAEHSRRHALLRPGCGPRILQRTNIGLGRQRIEFFLSSLLCCTRGICGGASGQAAREINKEASDGFGKRSGQEERKKETSVMDQGVSDLKLRW